MPRCGDIGTRQGKQRCRSKAAYLTIPAEALLTPAASMTHCRNTRIQSKIKDQHATGARRSAGARYTCRGTVNVELCRAGCEQKSDTCLENMKRYKC